MSDKNTIGPNCKATRLRNLDGRTGIAKFMKAVREDLITALGGIPGPGQTLIIDLAAVKAARLRMLSEQLLSGDLPPEEGERRFTWHANSLRRDLQALGLDKPSNAPTESLSDYIGGHAA